MQTPSIPKPAHIFDRDDEWQGLARFSSSSRPSATLGVVSGRLRQGKSYLLDAMTEATGGLYFPAIEATETESLRMFREARYLLAEETDMRVLEDCRLLVREPDLLRAGRSRYRVVEPLISFYHAVMRSRWAELERGRAEAVWEGSRADLQSQVVGPHFEALAREFALWADPELLGELPGEVGAGTVNDAQNRTQMEVDVVVLSPASPDEPRRVLSLGEVKWGETMGIDHLRRLARARDLLSVKGFDVGDAVLACYSGAGFTAELREVGDRGEALLVDPERLYE